MNCPFLEIRTGEYSCIYCIKGKCDDMEINTNNGDAWCREQIENVKIQRRRAISYKSQIMGIGRNILLQFPEIGK